MTVLVLSIAMSGLALLLLPATADEVVARPVNAAPFPTTSQPPVAGTATPEPAQSLPPEETTASVPLVEALIPATVDTLRAGAAESVGFVLTQQGTGSGVVISENLLVTNAHVTWPDRTVSLVFLNGATFQGRVVAVDPFVDLAVIDVSRLSRKPPPIAIGNAGDMEVGDPAWVIGYPLAAEFTPEPTIDAGAVLGFTDWEFTEARWVTVDAPAIGGQSGGAVVDEFGRLVGISTFGSNASLTSIEIDDVLTRVDSLVAAADVRGLEPRLFPHGGGRRTLDVELEGAWDQQLLLGWLPGGVDVDLDGSDLNLAVRTIGGEEIAAGPGHLDFRAGLIFPVIVAVESTDTIATKLQTSLPFIPYDDPDHGKLLPRRGTTAGVYEVGHDRDFFYLDLVDGEDAAVTVESAARTHLWVYDPDGRLVAEDVDSSGFVSNNASVRLTAASSGRYTVALESSLSSISGYAVVTQ